MENNGIDEREAEKDETNEQVHGRIDRMEFDANGDIKPVVMTE